MPKLENDVLPDMVVVALLALDDFGDSRSTQCQPASTPPVRTTTTRLALELVILIVEVAVQIDISIGFCFQPSILISHLRVVDQRVAQFHEPSVPVHGPNLSAVRVQCVGLAHT
jgi:hypothetical protein